MILSVCWFYLTSIFPLYINMHCVSLVCSDWNVKFEPESTGSKNHVFQSQDAQSLTPSKHTPPHGVEIL